MNTYKSHETQLLIAFGLRLRKCRLKIHLSQEELAELTGLHRTYIGSAERGERNISILNVYKIAEALNVSIETLLID